MTSKLLPLLKYVSHINHEGWFYFNRQKFNYKHLHSPNSKYFFTGQFQENETNEIHFKEIPSHVLQKVCMYFTYKVRYTNSSTEIPEFPIPPEIALELLMAANFLDC